jgi:NAD(P)-dependent dehydrogenase (short-subunit alcohol dehydrogenase family)
MRCLDDGRRFGSDRIDGTGLLHLLSADDGVSALIAARGRASAVEYGQHGIRANCLLPSMFESEFGQETATDEWIRANAAMRRAGKPAELGGIAVYLASSASSYHSDDSIVIDGGLTVQRGAA